MQEKGFKAAKLSAATRGKLKELARVCRGDILKMTTMAGCGHPGGSMSSMEMYLLLWSLANVAPDRVRGPRPRPRWWCRTGTRRRASTASSGGSGSSTSTRPWRCSARPGSLFEGHVERAVPGVEWSTGNLGQGLSAACGFALSAQLLKKDFRVYVMMGDGEQEKGQMVEAQRFAAKYRLTNLVGAHRPQLPPDIRRHARGHADGRGRAVQARRAGTSSKCKDGNDLDQLYAALHKAVTFDERPDGHHRGHRSCPSGVPFMENKEEWHGKALPEDRLQQGARASSASPTTSTKYKAMRKAFVPGAHAETCTPPVKINAGEPRTYPVDKASDNRGAWGNALEDLAKANKDRRVLVADRGIRLRPRVIGADDAVRQDHAGKLLPGRHLGAPHGGDGRRGFDAGRAVVLVGLRGVRHGRGL